MDDEKAEMAADRDEAHSLSDSRHAGTQTIEMRASPLRNKVFRGRSPSLSWSRAGLLDRQQRRLKMLAPGSLRYDLTGGSCWYGPSG